MLTLIKNKKKSYISNAKPANYKNLIIFNIIFKSVKSYIVNTNIKSLFYLFYNSFIFNVIILLFSLITLYSGLCTDEQNKIIIIIFIICYIGFNLIKKCGNNWKIAVAFMITLILNLLVLYLLWHMIVWLLPLFPVCNNNYLNNYFLLMGDGNTSGGDPSGSGSSGDQTGGGGDGNKPPKPKPNLKLDLPKPSEAEQDSNKISYCPHDKTSQFNPVTTEDLEAVCDFAGDDSSKHRAFDGLMDAAIICDECHAVFCKHCYTEYPDEIDTNDDGAN
jgi:hypothetical protein